MTTNDTVPPEAPSLAPPSLAALLGEFRGCFSAWSFPVFVALASGLLAQAGRRTVCGMLVGARLSSTWSQQRAHRFFSHSRWSPETLSAVLAALVVRLVVPDGAPVAVAIDDTLFHRRGPKVHAASWFHDGSATAETKTGYGNNWVIAAIVVRLGFLDRAVALPVGFALVRKDSEDSSRLALARRLVEALAVGLPGRRINVVADSAYAGRLLRGLPGNITWTTRLRSNAALYDLPPKRTAKRGRLRLKGAKLASLSALAAKATFTPTTFTPTTFTRYSTPATVQVQRTVPFTLTVSTLAVLWYATAGYHPDDIQQRHQLAPCYRDKTQPSVLDMFTKLRAVIIAHHLRHGDPQQPTSQEITILRLAWENVAA